MDEKALMEAIQDGKVFKVGNSYIFVAQVPDVSVGCSGSRCSNCGNEAAFCNQICRSCNLPFVGPVGFPQWLEWRILNPGEKRRLARDAYSCLDHGRLGYANVKYVPLSCCELREIERLRDDDAYIFQHTHGVSVQAMRGMLRT